MSRIHSLLLSQSMKMKAKPRDLMKYCLGTANPIRLFQLNVFLLRAACRFGKSFLREVERFKYNST